MSDARGLLDRITAFRQRLEETPRIHLDTTSDDVLDDGIAFAEEIEETIAQPEAFRLSLRQIAGAADVAEGPVPPVLTGRAHRLLREAKELLDRQRTFSEDPILVGLSAARDDESDPLVAYHHETVAILDTAVRLAQAFPESATAQLKLCDGLDCLLDMIRARLIAQERALASRRLDLKRIDQLAALYAAMHQGREVNLAPVAALAEELLDEARRTQPIRFLYVPPGSTRAYPGAAEFPAPARYIAAHALTAAQVVARIVSFDYEWAARPMLPVAGALLMDGGMMVVPVEVLSKDGPLTPTERRMIETHSRRGSELISGLVTDGIALIDAIAAHHERADGTGYPLGLKSPAIPSLSQILAAADVYAALCCPRPYRPACDTRAALTEVLLMAERGLLQRDFTEYLIHLSFYPVGTVVELTDGRVGVIAANHPNRLDPRAMGRPVVAVLAEADGTLLPRADHLDLSAAEHGAIVRTLPADRRRQLLGHRYPDLA